MFFTTMFPTAFYIELWNKTDKTCRIFREQVFLVYLTAKFFVVKNIRLDLIHDCNTPSLKRNILPVFSDSKTVVSGSHSVNIYIKHFSLRCIKIQGWFEYWHDCGRYYPHESGTWRCSRGSGFPTVHSHQLADVQFVFIQSWSFSVSSSSLSLQDLVKPGGNIY